MSMVELLFWMIAAMGAGAAAISVGYRGGKKAARLEDKRKALASCAEAEAVIFINPSSVRCPCQCGGFLESDGRNKQDTLSFLICSRCRCCYVARDKAEAKAS